MMNSNDCRYFEANLSEETLFRRRYNVNNNRGYAHLLLNTFPTKKLSNEIANICRGNELYISEWLLFRLVALAKYEYDRYEDIHKDNMYKLTHKPVDNVNHEENFKIYCLWFTIKTLSVFLSSTYTFMPKDKKMQDKLIIDLFYNMVRKLNCIEIMDDIINYILNKEESVEDFYNEVIEYSIISTLMIMPISNPYELDIKLHLSKHIKYDMRTFKDYTLSAYKAYDKQYSTYAKLNDLRYKLSADMSYFNLRDKFEKSLFDFKLENFELLTLNDIAQEFVSFYDGYRDEKFIDVLLNKFGDKYKYIGKVYHGTRSNLNNINRPIEESVKTYVDGYISSSKDIKIAYEFSKFNDYVEGEQITHYGFVTEIDITEDMKAIDIHKLLLDLREELPDLTTWISDYFVNEQEVLIPAEYVQLGKVLSCADIDEMMK